MEKIFKNKEVFKEAFKEAVGKRAGRDFEDTFVEEQYLALGDLLRDYVSDNWKETKKAVKEAEMKQLYYFSMEFLLGRLLTNNLMNLGVYSVVKEGLEDLGVNLHDLEIQEADPGLGNGGLGRLAACFLDSLASLDLAGNGNCIRYRYGLFKQEIENCEQIEKPDCWLRLGNVWETWKPHHDVLVKFGGHLNAWMDENGKFHSTHEPDFTVRAVPYDMPVVGYHTKTTNTLRLWDAQVDETSVGSGQLESYLNEVNAITTNVYPDDSTAKGKELRLKH